MKPNETTKVTCPACRAVNTIEGQGVPKVQCSSCGRVIAVQQQRPRMETR